MANNKTIKSLKTLSTQAIFQHLVIQLTASTPPSSLKPQLDEYLVSWYSQVRWKLVKRFVTIYCCGPHGNCFNLHLLLPFFHSVLDSSFKHLEITSGTKHLMLPLPDPTAIMEIVASRSPHLQTLAFSFKLPSANAPLSTLFCLQVAKLSCLTDLTLLFKTTDSCLNFFKCLGLSCPHLSNLCMGKVPFYADQVLALMLGAERFELLPPNFPKSTKMLMGTQFRNCLTPICTSLKKLRYDCGVDDNDKETCQSPPVDLILRHFPNLEKLECSSCESWVPNKMVRNSPEWFILTTNQQNAMRASQEPKSTTIHSMLDEKNFIEWVSQAPFTDGPLKLVQLQNVDLRNRRMIQAVTSLCPYLKEVQFCFHQYRIPDRDNLSAQNVRSMLNREKLDPSSCWSNVELVKFNEVPPDYRRAVLSVLGHQLKSLEFASFSTGIDVINELLPYSQLEELFILSFCSFVPPVPTDALPSANAFLPYLKILKSYSSLEDWSPLFECYRPMLKTLRLMFTQLNIPSRSQFNWIDVPKLWPNLRKLRIHQADGLTIDAIKSIVPQLAHLQVLSLSEDIFSSEDEVNMFEQFALEFRHQVPTGPVIEFHLPLNHVVSHH